MKKKEKIKRTMKDSVFTHLFRDPAYLIQLYRVAHPEDKSATEADLKNITIENVITDNIYNDLGFRVGERLMILVECQSTWTPNMTIRLAMYYLQILQTHFAETGQSVYLSKQLAMPKPEFYLVYTGEHKHTSDVLSLSEEFWQGEPCDFEIKVHILKGQQGDIVYQYHRFVAVYTEQCKLHGKTEKAIIETINICKEENVLKDFLEKYQREVMNLMFDVFNQEKILEDVLRSTRHEGMEEGEKIGLQKGEKLGLQKGEKLGLQKGEKLGLQKGEKLGLQKGEKLGIEKTEIKMIKSVMQKLNCSIQEAMDFVDIPLIDRPRYVKLVQG